MINKIDGPGGVRGPQSIRRAGKTSSTSSTGFSKAMDDVGDTEATNGISGTNAVSGVLGVQEVEDALTGRSKGKMRAQDILDRLDDLRVSILTGAISRDKLLQLTHLVNSKRGEIDDPRLVEILDEIDLRAQVELAKHSMQGVRS